MIGEVFAIFLRLAADPVAAGYVAAAVAGSPELGDRLAAICARESKCRPIGVHAVDARLGRAAWSNAAGAGALEPSTCRHHRWDAGPWSTSGPWGMMRAYTLRHLGCWPAWVLDIPAVGAAAAVLRMRSAACARTPACASWAGFG